VPLYFLSRETKGRATVVLTGEGADEFFLGYDKYTWAQRQARIAAAFQRVCPRPLHRSAIRVGHRLFGSRRLLDRLLMAPGEIAASFYHEAPAALVAELIADTAPALVGRRESGSCSAAFDRAPAERDFLSRMTYMDAKTFLITLLMKQDKMSMAASIESRVPFLDFELVEYAYRLSTARKLRAGVGKSILKDIAVEYLPRELLHREKRGFPVPVTPWFQSPSTRSRLEEILLDPRTVGRGIFRQSVVEDHLRRVVAQQDQTGAEATYLAWNLVNFELWQRMFVDRDRAASVEHGAAPDVRPSSEAGSR